MVVVNYKRLGDALNAVKNRMLFPQAGAYETDTWFCLSDLFKVLGQALLEKDAIQFDDILCYWHRNYPDVTDLMFDELFSELNIESRDELTSMLGIGQE